VGIRTYQLSPGLTPSEAAAELGHGARPYMSFTNDSRYALKRIVEVPKTKFTTHTARQEFWFYWVRTGVCELMDERSILLMPESPKGALQRRRLGLLGRLPEAVTVRAIIEAETPKDVFRRMTATDPAFEWVEDVLERARWQPFGTQNNWGRVWSGRDYRYELRRHGVPSVPERKIWIWWDADAKEWVFKVEGQKKHFGRWCGWHELQLRMFKTGRELLKGVMAYNPALLPSDFEI
jgi:hypothetical protein